MQTRGSADILEPMSRTGSLQKHAESLRDSLSWPGPVRPREWLPHLKCWDCAETAAPPMEDLLYYQGLILRGTWQASDSVRWEAEKYSE